MATPYESINGPAITRELADAFLCSAGNLPFLRRLVDVLLSDTLVLILRERAGIIDLSATLREVSNHLAYAERELDRLRKADGGGFVTFSGHSIESMRLMQSMLTEAARRLVLADREAQRLWDMPDIVERARAINARLIESPRGVSEATRERWKDWRNRNLPARRAA